MTSEDHSIVALAEPSKPYIKSANAEETNHSKRKYRRKKTNNNEESEEKQSVHWRFASLPSRLSFGRFRKSVRKLSCVKKVEEEEELPMMEVQRHKSIDIGVGFARKMSLFIFTRRTVCVHPYHPYTPEQTTRKIYIWHDDK